jgi:hypothetical protein
MDFGVAKRKPRSPSPPSFDRRRFYLDLMPGVRDRHHEVSTSVPSAFHFDFLSRCDEWKVHFRLLDLLPPFFCIKVKLQYSSASLRSSRRPFFPHGGRTTKLFARVVLFVAAFPFPQRRGREREKPTRSGGRSRCRERERGARRKQREYGKTKRRGS